MAGDAEPARGWQAPGMAAWGRPGGRSRRPSLDREETPEALEGLGVATGGWATPAPRPPSASGPAGCTAWER
jgi:hypothetical protein